MSLLRFLIFAFLISTVAISADAQSKKVKRRDGDLKEGDRAADFTLKDAAGRNPVTLSKLQGKPVVLIFGSCT